MRTPKLQLTAEQLLTGQYWIPPTKDTLYPRVKEKPQHDGRRGKIAFRIKPLICQRCSEGSNKPYVHQDPETPQRLSQNCVSVSPAKVWVSSSLLQGQRQGQGLWAQQTWIWHKPSRRRSPLAGSHDNHHFRASATPHIQVSSFNIQQRGFFW